MPYFRYTGPYERVYPEIMTPDGSLTAVPGMTAELDVAPDDGYWADAEQPDDNAGKAGRQKASATPPDQVTEG